MPASKTTSRSRRPAPPPLDTRGKILQAALAAFADHGFRGASTRDIAAAAGVNQGLITYHFAGKEALWQAAVDSIFATLRDELGQRIEALEDVDPMSRLRAVMKHFVRFSAHHPELHRLMVEEGRHDSPRLKWLVDNHVRPLYEISTGLVRAAQKLGIAGNVAPLHLHYMLVGAAAHVFTVAPEVYRVTGIDPLDPEIVEAHGNALVEVLLDALMPTSTAGTGRRISEPESQGRSTVPASRTSRRRGT